MSLGADVLYNNLSKAVKTAGLAALGALFLWLALRFLLPIFLPLLLSLLAALAIERPVARLTSRAGMKRGAAAGAVVLLLFGGAAGVLWLLFSRLASEVRALVSALPQLIEGLSQSFERLRAYLGTLAPARGGGAMQEVFRGVEDYLLTLPAALSDLGVKKLGALAKAAPNVLMFLVTATLGTYFVSASLPQLRETARTLLPERARGKMLLAALELKRTLGRWLRAQGIMTLIMFAMLTLAFLLLKTGYALLLALVTAVVDALPVLGTGTVLIPWGVFSLISGDVPRGVGLLITYAATAVLRSSLQAKLIGDQLGLSPILSLFSIYAGFRLCGVWGMILFPIAAVLLVRLLRTRAAREWLGRMKNGGENDDGLHFQYDSGHGDERAGRDEYTPR